MARSSHSHRSAFLQRRLTFLLLSVGLLPLLVVAMLNNLQSARTLADLTEAQLSELAISSAEKLDRDLSDRYANVQAFARSEAARSMDAERIVPLMDEMTAIYAPFYRLMIVANRDGEVIAASSQSSIGTALDTSGLLGTRIRGEQWFDVWREQTIQPDQTFVEDVHVDRRVAALYGDDGYVLAFSAGIFDDQGNLIGVWLNLVDWNFVKTLLADSEARPHAQGATTVHLTIVNRDGLIIAGPNNPFPLSRTYVPPAHVLVQRAALQGYGDQPIDLNWSVIATQERNEALAVARSQTLQTLLAAVGLGVFVLLLGLVAARMITKPLRNLQAGAEQVAGGNLHVTVPRGPGEIGMVADAFNSMTSQLRNLYNNLEQQVTERTAELEATLNDLQQRTAELQTSQDQLSISNRTLMDSEARYRSLFERTQEILNETQVLYRTARSLIATEQLRTVLQAVIDGVVEVLNANAVALMTLDAQQKKKETFVRGGPQREVIDESMFSDLSRDLVGWVLNHAQPALSPGTAPDPRETELAQQERKRRGWGSMIVVPLRYRNHIHGVMVAVNQREQREFTPHDVELMVTMGNQAAVALQNARLYAAAQQELTERRRIEEELRSYQEHLEEQVSLRTAELAQVATELVEKNESLREGVELARDIQLGLLPERPPWDMAVLEVQGRSVAASAVGGDFYTFISTHEAGGMIAIGDISGKGVGAALMMALTTSALETEARMQQQPAALLDTLNQLLSPRLRANKMNAAVALVNIHYATRTAQIGNAGMIAPLLLRKGALAYLDVAGFPLGSSELPYRDIRITLEQDDIILLVSDGVVEAHNNDEQLYGFERLEACLARCMEQSLGLEQLINVILEDVLAFTGDAEPHDDITIVAMRPQLPSVPNYTIIETPSDAIHG